MTGKISERQKIFAVCVRMLFCLALIFMLVTQTAAADAEPEGPATVDPVGHSENYSAVMYDNTNGLPTAEANDIVQTGEGFIWIGSYGGLTRYDGNTFERMDSRTGVGSVTCLHVDRRDRLWIGTNDSGLALMEEDKFRIWDEYDGLNSATVIALEEDNEGNIYAGTIEGIVMISPDLTLHTIDDPEIAGAYIERIKISADGVLYGITSEDDYFTIKNGKLLRYVDHTKTRITGITSFLPDPENAEMVYFGTEDAKFYHVEINKKINKDEYIDIAPMINVMDIQKFGDQIWITSRNGIGVIDGDGFHYMDELPMNNSVSHVMKDYEGNLWFTSSRQGVMKLVSNKFTDIFKRYDLPKNVVNATCMYDGKLLIGTDTGLIALGNGSRITEMPLTSAVTASGKSLGSSDLLDLLNGCRIRSIIKDSKDRLWIATWRACGLLRYDHGDLTVFNEDDGLLSNQVRVISEASDGSVVVALTGGLNIIRDDKVVVSMGEKDGITNSESLTVCNAPNGDIILGSNGSGIFIINDEGVRHIGKQDGLASEIIMRVKRDTSRDLYWIVTSNSIAYMTGDYKVTTVDQFPYSNNFDLYQNSKDDMWILSSNGIYVLPTEEMTGNGNIKPAHYGLSNGLPCTSTSNSYSELTDNGDLYISGSKGVVKVNIEESMEKISSLKLAVPFVDADGDLVFPDAYGQFTIPSSTQKLTIYGYVYNYSLTDPQVSYRLIGFDRRKITVSRSEFGPVSYTNLRGGSYRFRMELNDAMGRGSNSVSIAITKERAIYEQTWFFVILGACAAALLLWASRQYYSRKMTVMEERHHEETERQRVNDELHMASGIQTGMLPSDFPPFPDRAEFDIYASMKPAREVGGDFYDFFMIDDDHLCMVIADVSGKGIPAALFMMNSMVTLRNATIPGMSAAEILEKANDFMCSKNKMEMFVTVWLGILELSTGKLNAANAGHEYPAVKHSDGSFDLLKDKHGVVIGAMEGAVYHDYEITLRPGDKVFVYTDGVPEAANSENEMFGTDRMIEALNAAPDASPEEMTGNVRSEVETFAGDAEQFDDITMLALEYKGS